VFLTYTSPPNWLKAFSISDLDLDFVPLNASLETYVETELLAMVSCLLPALTATVIAA